MMRTGSIKRLSIVGLAALGACAAIACSGGSAGPGAGADNAPGASPSSDTSGSIGARLTLTGGVTLAAATYTITSPTGFNKSANVDLTSASALSFTVGGLPAGTGYSITLTATSVDGVTSCLGSATFSVTARATSQVVIHLECHQQSTTGTANITGTDNVCPVIDGVSASPNEVFVGGSLGLTGAAHDADNGPSPLSYQWTATSGVLATPSAQNTSFQCTTPGVATVTLTVSDGDNLAGCPATLAVTVTCDATDGGASTDAAASDATVGSDASDAAPLPPQALFTTIDPGVSAIQVTINQGTAIGEGSLNGATPSTLTNVAADPNNTQTLTVSNGDFLAAGHVPDTAAGFCAYSADGGAPTRVSYVTGAKFETAAADGGPGTDPMVPMAPFYFPLTYTTTNTPTPNAFGGLSPIIGLFDWRPKDIDEGLVAAESDDNGRTWYFMQTVLELNPDYTNPISGGYSPTSTDTGCPATIGSTNANHVSANGSQADDGWGHAAIIQLPGAGNVKTGQFLYMLDRNTNNLPGQNVSVVDNAPLHVINLTGSTNKFPIWNTNNTSPGNNDIKSIITALNNTTDAGANVVAVRDSVGLLNPDGIMAVFPTSPTAAAGSPVTVLYVQKILNGDNTGPTALPLAQQCKAAPFSGKTNHDISNVRLATTTDGVNFTDLGIVSGLSDPTTVDYNKTRWVSPRGTLLDIHGDGSLWGLYFSAGNCLDGDSDAFHYIGYAESTDMMHWVVYNGINNPIASINPITTTNQADGTTVTIPANAPIIPLQPWFAERLYAPTATRIDATHLSMTFAGYGAQTPNNDLLAYRAIGNVVLTVSSPLPAGVPNNINTH
jgi:hypothetical protein